jgi:L-alanine-DL-glutamate epimerase-like enolase superfamily enzyme
MTGLGFKGCKFGLGKRGDARLGSDIRRDVEFMRLLRERVGPEPMLMWDRGVNTLTWDVAFAIRLTAALEEHGLTWMEEPFEPADLDSFRRLKSRCSTLIGSGEREWNVEGYRSFIAAGVADVIGFDPGRAEGITGGRRVIELVEEGGAWFNAHAWSSAIVTAASLALSLTTPRTLVFELKAEESPMQHELVESPVAQSGGWVHPLTGAGLGIEVREDVVEKYRF